MIRAKSLRCKTRRLAIDNGHKPGLMRKVGTSVWEGRCVNCGCSIITDSASTDSIHRGTALVSKCAFGIK